ncbi:hypothetical protein [Calothrix sp. PCC 6303]|uniref:hypothetical protein n=1 Tax=Calothrix sp. PCC 6303 TaxID=1170562 RepID=UPI0002A0052A|nr:hypothetical protein [Calothrix sp. PCC 6303]AFZ02582.1 hypothetical protein Cal6303_3657 [Calothrix sp. PCC 6303]
MHGYTHKICHFLLGSAFILISSITLAEGANADEPIMAASVPNSCDIFSKLSDGELGVNGTNTILSSNKAYGGSPGLVIVDCAGFVDISISAPAQEEPGTSKTKFPTAGLSATATDATSTFNIQSGTAKKPLPEDYDGQIEVNMTADNQGSTILPGEYNFTVTLTVTSQ